MPRNELLMVPNLVSLARILAAPFVYLLLSAPAPAALPLIFLTAGIIISDFLDGALARRLGQTSRLGLVLDPLGDKACLIAAIMALLVSGRISPVLFGALLFKDTAILLGAALLAGKKRIIIPSNAAGKWTTALLACGLAALALSEILAREGTAPDVALLLSILAAVARCAVLAGTVLAILSLAGYAVEALRQIGKHPPALALYAAAFVFGGFVVVLVLLATGLPSLKALPGPWL